MALRRPQRHTEAPSAPSPQAPAQLFEATFLGVLPSDIVEDDELHETYRAIVDAVREVVQAVGEGQVNEREAAVRLAQLRARDSRGVEWTVGASTLRWYRRVGGGSWTVAHAPTLPPATDRPRPWYAVHPGSTPPPVDGRAIDTDGHFIDSEPAGATSLDDVLALIGGSDLAPNGSEQVSLQELADTELGTPDPTLSSPPQVDETVGMSIDFGKSEDDTFGDL